MLEGEEKGKAQLEGLAARRRDAEVVRFSIFFPGAEDDKGQGWMDTEVRG